MYQVIDSILYDETLHQNVPETKRFGHGLMVILNPSQIRTAPFQVGEAVEIRRPDRTTLIRNVGGVEIGAQSVVGVFFEGCSISDIPRLSEIESIAVKWDQALTALEILKKEMPIGSGGLRLTREQLYERELDRQHTALNRPAEQDGAADSSQS